MDDYATKHYLQPDSHAAKLERAIKALGKRYSLHKSSTFAFSPEKPTVLTPEKLTPIIRKNLLRQMAQRRGK